MGSEKLYERKIRKYIEHIGGYSVKYFGCAYSESGTPDILACINGYFVAIEVKAQNGKPSALQMVKVREIREAGGFAYIVYPSGFDKLKDILDGLLIDKFNREEGINLA